MLIEDFTKKNKQLLYPTSILIIVALIYVNIIQPFSLESTLGERFVTEQWYDTAFNIDQFQYFSLLVFSLAFLVIWHILRDRLGILLSTLIPISLLFLVTSTTLNNYESILLVPLLFIFWAFKKLSGIKPVVISSLIILIWGYFSVLFLLGVIIMLLLIFQNKYNSKGTKLKVAAMAGLASIVMLFACYNKVNYWPPFSLANHLEKIANYDTSAVVLVISFLFSMYLFIVLRSKNILLAVILALSFSGFLLDGFQILIAIAIVMFLETYSSILPKKKPNGILHLFIYLGCIATLTATANNFPIQGDFFRTGLSEEQEQIKHVLNPLNINGNVLCTEADKMEAKFYFGGDSKYNLLPVKELIAEQWDWLNFRMDNGINIVYFNLNNKFYEELVCLGEILGDSEWALIYHTPQSKAILLRRELEFKSIITKFEIDKSQLMNN